MKKILLAVTLVAACLAAHAQSSPWRFVAGVGFADGGEKIASGTITTIGTNKVMPFDIQSGTGFQGRIGAEYRLTGQLSVQATIGHAASEAMGINGSLDFTTIPVELMGFADVWNGLRLGAGLRQSHAELRGTGISENFPLNGTYTGGPGSVLELQYLFQNGAAQSGAASAQFGLSLRHVTESFTHTLGTLKGDHYEVGAVLYY
jgi:hypothetical protein